MTKASSRPEALLLACHQNDDAAAMKILCGASTDTVVQFMQASDPSGLTPLLAAAKHGAARVVQALLSRDADLAECLHASRNTALHLAAVNGNVQAVKCIADKMCEMGISVDIRNNNGDTPLMFSAAAGHIGAAATLLKAGANIDVRNGDGLTPLLVGASHAGILKLLTRVGNKSTILGARDMHGNGPLHIACRSGSPEAVAFLLEQGRNVTERNLAGRTPRDEAELSGNAECIRLVEEVWAQMEELSLQRSRALLQEAVSGGGSSSGSCHGGSISDEAAPTSPTSETSNLTHGDQQKGAKAPETPMNQPPKPQLKLSTPLESPFASSCVEAPEKPTTPDPKCSGTPKCAPSPPSSTHSVVASRDLDADGLRGSSSMGMYYLQYNEWMTANCWQEHLDDSGSSPSTPTSTLRSSLLHGAESVTAESIDMRDLDSGTWQVSHRPRRHKSKSNAQSQGAVSNPRSCNQTQNSNLTNPAPPPPTATAANSTGKSKQRAQSIQQQKQAGSHASGGNGGSAANGASQSQRPANVKATAAPAPGGGGVKQQGGSSANSKPTMSKSPPTKSKVSPKRSKSNSQAKLPFPHVVSGIYPPPQQSTSPPKPLPSKLTVKTTVTSSTSHPHRSSPPPPPAYYHPSHSQSSHSHASSDSQSHSDDSFYDWAWEILHRDCPAAGTLGLSVQNALGSGLSCLSMSQLEALEGFHHAALARLSDARFALTRQLELDRTSEQHKLMAEVASLAARLRMYEGSGGSRGVAAGAH